MNRGLFLDRDGVVNELVYYPSHREWESPRRIEDLRMRPGITAALREANRRGWLLFLITNQPSYAKGKCPLENLEQVHNQVLEHLRSDDVVITDSFVCYHHPDSQIPGYGPCLCRKPSPHFIREAAARYDLDLTRSWMAGDSGTDIEAGRNAGCRTALIEYEHSAARRGTIRPDLVCADLAELVQKIESMPMPNLRIHLYSDGADVRDMVAARSAGLVKGFTTNPTLMRKSGISDYESFAKDALKAVSGMPISFEVFADEFDEMERQAKLIATWGEGVFVKIPVTNTRGESAVPLIRRLSKAGVKLNVTAILTLQQVRDVVDALDSDVPAIVSVFAGRIADTGRDPVPLMREARAIVDAKPKAQLLWASPRELLNIIQADECGCHIITVTPDILKKLAMVGKSLDELSLDTVKMFYKDAAAAGFKL
jgi:transaldolase